VTRIDRFRLFAAGLLVLLGAIVLVRAVFAAAVPVVILGGVMLALGLYRLNQFWRYRSAVDGR